MTRYLSSYLQKTLLDEPDNASFESALNNENISYYFDVYAKLRHDARTGHLGNQEKTPGIKKEDVSFYSFSQL
jgi:hypothetical protein